ncbi:MAG: MFS transporter, partial [Pseudomonadales bacterium]
LVERMDARVLIIFGLACMAISLWEMSLFDRNVTSTMLINTGMLQGFGMGFMFVPMSSMAFATLEPKYRADGSGLYSLGRNIGSSVGISVLMGMLAVYVRANRENLVTHINPFNPLLKDSALLSNLDPSHGASLEMLNGLVQREAVMLGYLDDFRLMMLFTLVAVPVVLLLRPVRREQNPAVA